MDNVYFTRHSKKPVEVSNRKRLAAFTLHSGVEPSCLAKSDIVIDLIDYKCFFLWLLRWIEWYHLSRRHGTTLTKALFWKHFDIKRSLWSVHLPIHYFHIKKKMKGWRRGGGGVLTQIFELHSDSSVLHPHARVYWSTFSKLFDPAFQVS